MPSFLAEYAGALVTADVVGRQDILEKIHQAIRGKEPRVFYLLGEGGIGKTCLLRAVLQRCQPGDEQDNRPAGEWYREGLVAALPDLLVDLYHTTMHTREGLARALRESLSGAEGAFQRFDAAYAEWEERKFDLAGMLKELSKLRDRVGEAFLEDLQALARERRVVIALDTAERLLYGEDEIQRRLGLEPEEVEALDWLRQVLPQLENVIVLLAGRPGPPRLREDLEHILGDRLIVVELESLDWEGTKAYFDAVVARARELGLDSAAVQIEAIPEDIREVIWRYTAGRPILLALLIDYLLVSDELLPRVKEPLEQVRRRSEKELKDIREEVKHELVRFWQESGREADQAINALAWAPKGMDAELLARVAELRRDGGGWDVERAQKWLEEIRDLSFIKVRPADERVFLHDEMYALFQENVLSIVPEVRRKRVYDAILRYYEGRITAMRQRVWELSQPRRAGEGGEGMALGMPKPPDDPAALARATARLWMLMSEEVYYRLRYNPLDGYKTYLIYVKEAYWSYEDALERLLRSELLDFRGKWGDADSLGGLHRAVVDVDAGLRRVERLKRDVRNREALSLLRKIWQKCSDLLEQAGLLAETELQVLEGEILTYLGEEEELSRAGALLESGLAGLETFRPKDEFEEWRCQVLLAEAHNTLGYYYRNLGRFRKAVEVYRRAVAQWRLLEQGERDRLRRMALRAQHANTLNNLSWAVAEQGRLAEAAHFCEDALEMRVVLGPAAPVALSLNTYGLILVRDDKPHRARVMTSRALGIFRDLNYPRGVGLSSIALAEALRRMSAVEYLYAPEEQADLLRQAAQHAAEAVEIFSSPQMRERSRLVEALIERGCVYRQWAWLRPQYEAEEDPTREELARRSEEDLRRAMEEAGEAMAYRRLDAHVDLAWLYYYMREYRRAEEEAQAAIASVPEEYRFEKGWPDKERLPYSFYWSLLGKAYLLLGEIAMRQFEYGECKEEEYLRKGGFHYTLGLAYDELYAEDFRDLRRAIYRIYIRIRRLNEEEFASLHEGIREAVKVCGEGLTRMDRLLAERNLPVRPEVE